MQPLRKHLLKTAAAVHERLVDRKGNGESIQLPPWENVSRLAKQVDLACRRGWHLAAAQLKQDLFHEIDCFRRRLESLLPELDGESNPVKKPSAADIYADLVALEDEFEEVAWDTDKQELQVTTAPINLDGMEFGRFQVCLELNSQRGGHSYHVVALDARPAASNESVTHPHVSNEELCEGDGRPAIRSALDSGRLLDFFTIVGRLLGTYAPGRAYVDLENWGGTPCHDCGSSADDDERSNCEKCGATLCGDCGSLCSKCDTVFCAECISSCSTCDQTCCRACLDECQQCGRRVCTDCLEEGFCSRCKPVEPDHDDNEDEASTTSPEFSGAPATDAALQSHGLGQAAVPA
jgi:hypothetical protein